MRSAFDRHVVDGPAPERLPQPLRGGCHPVGAPAARTGHHRQALALPAVVGAGIGPGGGPQQRHPQPLRIGAHPLGPIEQHRQPASRRGLHRGQPPQGRHLPAGLLRAGEGSRWSLDHPTGDVGRPAQGRPGQGQLQPQQLMPLAPIHRQGELQVGAGRPQAALQPQRAGATAATPQEPGAEGTALQPAGLPLPDPGQGMGTVIGGDVPGVPELTAVGPAAPGQRGGQAGTPPGVPDLLDALGPQLHRDLAVLQPPAAADLRLGPHPHRIERRRLGWRGRWGGG